MDRIIEILCAIVSAVWIYVGLSQYGFWTDKTPGGGFMPVLIGGLTLIFCVVLFVKGKHKPATINKNAFFPVLVVLGAIVFIKVLGMISTVAIMVFVWLKLYEKYTYGRSGFIALITTIFVYGIFKMWLQVPFPTGFIGI